MTIKELEILNFGRFNCSRISLNPGINIIYGENEAGKTTIADFIRGMFFGIDKQRGKAARSDLYAKYEPWDNPAYYAGRMRFETGGKEYCLSRDFNRYQKKAELICEEDGKSLDIEAGDLRGLLGGMDEAVYRNTIAIHQLKAKTDEGLADAFQNYLANFQSSGDLDINVSRAVGQLKTQRRKLEADRKHLLLERDDEIAKIESRLSYISQESEQQKAKLEGLGEEQGGPGKRKMFVTGLRYLLLALFVLVVGVAGVYFIDPLYAKIVYGALLFFSEIYLIFRAMSIGEPEEEESEDPPKDSKRAWIRAQLKEEIAGKQIEMHNLKEQITELQADLPQLTKIDTEIKALDLAVSRIEKLSAGISQSLGGPLSEKASEVLAKITKGRYQRIVIDADFKIQVLHDGRFIDLYQLSTGTVDQIYFAVRMAIGDIMFPGRQLPILLDDTFAMYDTPRLLNTLAWLYASGRQVVLFSCQNREKVLLQHNKIPFTLVEM